MSYDVSDAVWRLKCLSPTIRLVLLAIAKVFFNDVKEAIVSYDSLAAMTGFTERTIRIAVAEAEKLHLLQVVRKGGRERNHYRVLFDVVWRPRKDEPEKPDTRNHVPSSERNDVPPTGEAESTQHGTAFHVNQEPGSVPIREVQGSLEGNTHPPDGRGEAGSPQDSEAHYASKAQIMRGVKVAGPIVLPTDEEVVMEGLSIDPLMDRWWLTNWHHHALERAMRSTVGWKRCLRSNWLEDVQKGRVFTAKRKNGQPAGPSAMTKHNGGREAIKPKFV